MKKLLTFALIAAVTVGMTGCKTPEEAKAKAQQPLFEKFQKMSTKTLENGGIAVVGLGESKSLELALQKAKMRGRVELAQLLETKIEAIQKDFIEEVGRADEAQILAQFETTAKTITSQQIQGSVAKELKYETIGDTITAYALMELDPKIIMTQLAKEKELYTRFRASQAFEELDKEIQKYEAYKKEQANALMAK